MEPLELRNKTPMERTLLGSEVSLPLQPEYLILGAEGIRRAIKDAFHARSSGISSPAWGRKF